MILKAVTPRLCVAVELDDHNAEAWRLVGNGHFIMENREQAQYCYHRALELMPGISGVREPLLALDQLPRTFEERR